MARRMTATSRDPDAYSRATHAARVTRETVAGEVAAVIAEQVKALIVEGDIMGGRAAIAMRVRQVGEAERRGDRAAIRAAAMEASVAFAQYVAALDYQPPSDIVPRNGKPAGSVA